MLFDFLNHRGEQNLISNAAKIDEGDFFDGIRLHLQFSFKNIVVLRFA